jgi:uncharacterized membrane protein YqjE
MEIIKRLRSVAKIVLTRLELHGQLASVEWAEERHRLLQLLAFSLLGFIFLLCALLFVGIFAIALSWATDYRIHVVGAILALYILGFCFCAYRFSILAARSSATFAATREEVAADLALIRSHL